MEKQFSIFFPFLKLELHPSEITFSMDGAMNFSISGNETAAGLCSRLNEQFGWTAAIFRRDGDRWISISDDNSTILKQQNELGRIESMNYEETRYQDFLETEY